MNRLPIVSQFCTIGALVLLCASVRDQVPAQAKAPTLTLKPTINSFNPSVACVNEVVSAEFLITFDNPEVNKEAIDQGIASQKFTVTLSHIAPGQRKVEGRISSVTLRTGKDEDLAFTPQAPGPKGGFKLTLETVDKLPAKGVVQSTGTPATTPIIVKVRVVAAWPTPGTKEIKLDAEILAKGAAKAATGSATVTGVIVDHEAVFLRDLTSGNFAVNDAPATPPRPPNLDVLPGSNCKGNVHFRMVCAPKNAIYPWVLQRRIQRDGKEVLEEVDNSTKGNRHLKDDGVDQIVRNLEAGQYVLVVSKQGNASFARRINFTVLTDLDLVAAGNFIVPGSNLNAVRYRWSDGRTPKAIKMEVFDKDKKLVRTIDPVPTTFAPGKDFAEQKWNGAADDGGKQLLSEAKSPYRIRLTATRTSSTMACTVETTAKVEEWKLDLRIDDRPGGRETLVSGPNPDTITPETLEVRLKFDEAGATESTPRYDKTPRVKAPSGPPGNEWGCLVTPAHLFYTTPQSPYDIRYQVTIEQKTQIISAKTGDGKVVKTVLDGALNPWDMDPTRPGRQTKAIWQFGLNSKPDATGEQRRGLVEEYLP